MHLFKLQFNGILDFKSGLELSDHGKFDSTCVKSPIILNLRWTRNNFTRGRNDSRVGWLPVTTGYQNFGPKVVTGYYWLPEFGSQVDYIDLKWFICYFRTNWHDLMNIGNMIIWKLTRNRSKKYLEILVIVLILYFYTL